MREEVNIVIHIDGRETAYGIASPLKTSKYINYNTPLNVRAGPFISFVFKSDAPSAMNTAVSLLNALI